VTFRTFTGSLYAVSRALQAPVLHHMFADGDFPPKDEKWYGGMPGTEDYFSPLIRAQERFILRASCSMMGLSQRILPAQP